jgi:hypothetical protein
MIHIRRDARSSIADSLSHTTSVGAGRNGDRDVHTAMVMDANSRDAGLGNQAVTVTLELVSINGMGYSIYGVGGYRRECSQHKSIHARRPIAPLGAEERNTWHPKRLTASRLR